MWKYYLSKILEFVSVLMGILAGVQQNYAEGAFFLVLSLVLGRIAKEEVTQLINHKIKENDYAMDK